MECSKSCKKRKAKELNEKMLKAKNKRKSTLFLKVSDGPIHIEGLNGYGIRINQDNFKEIYNLCVFGEIK